MNTLQQSSKKLTKLMIFFLFSSLKSHVLSSFLIKNITRFA
ncbi:hypothetical protein CSC13_3298 [Klebsiella pneumoniae]|nr:hypothetical protein CSC13_3298 [Klebsiella pneumoniae]